MQVNDDDINILNEKSIILTSDKNNEYKLILSINENDILNITAITTKNIPLKKYSLSCSMNELKNYRFFKIFINMEEIYKELENKIQNSILMEESNLIYLDIPNKFNYYYRYII